METLTPKPFCSNKDQIKAFVLGCDPTGFDKNGNRLEFEYIFDIGKDKRYFAGILSNLAQVGLSLDDIYVQNLITEYLNTESSKNKAWLKIAAGYISARKLEFDQIDRHRQLPVFLTSELLTKAILNDHQPKYTASELYENPDLIPLTPQTNKLERPLIPLYRHTAYRLSHQADYAKRLRELLKNYTHE